MYQEEINPMDGLKVAGVIVGFIALVVIALMCVIPPYKVWSATKKGEAEYMRAEQNRRIKVEEAKANLEAEKLNAQAEIERAKGAAEASRLRTAPSLQPTSSISGYVSRTLTAITRSSTFRLKPVCLFWKPVNGNLNNNDYETNAFISS